LGAAPVSRRGFLRASAATCGALVAAGTAAGCLASDHYADLTGTETPETLTPKELAVLTAFAARVITPAESAPTATDARIARRVDRELVFSDGRLTGDVRAALALIEHGPVLDLRFRRFTRLPPEEQDAYLAACARSSWSLRRNAFAGLRFLCLFLYYSDDRTWRSIGYGGVMVDRKLPEASNAREALDTPVGAPRPA
jgi:hypothetical protein